jgi:hypothetical protein
LVEQKIGFKGVYYISLELIDKNKDFIGTLIEKKTNMKKIFLDC